MIVNNRAELEALPDGTIITWLRVPDDRTSEAVAFVRHEDDYDTPTAHGGPTRTTWVSPGGWQPMSTEEAKIQYPAVAFTDPTNYLGPITSVVEDNPWASDVITLERGGTWPREKALECASRAVSGGTSDVVNVDAVLHMADRFVDWLTRDELAEALNAEVMDPHVTPPVMTLGDMAETMRRWKYRGISRASTYYAVEQVWPYDATAPEDRVNVVSDIEWEQDGRTRSLQFELRQALTDTEGDHTDHILRALAIMDRYTSATREQHDVLRTTNVPTLRRRAKRTKEDGQ